MNTVDQKLLDSFIKRIKNINEIDNLTLKIEEEVKHLSSKTPSDLAEMLKEMKKVQDHVSNIILELQKTDEIFEEKYDITTLALYNQLAKDIIEENFEHAETVKNMIILKQAFIPNT